jgi:hypothetical protein
MISNQVYRALQTAAERMGANNYRAQKAAHRRVASTFRHDPTPRSDARAPGHRGGNG